MVANLRWGILGPGAIARVFATAIDGLDGHEIAAVGSRDPQRALAFNAERGYVDAKAGTYGDLVRNESVDAVYVASPHPGHLEHAALALRHGKAVLCEKPLCVNASEARRLCEIARERGRPLLEAMWTRFLPATQRAADWIANGTIGEPSRVVCSFGFRAAFDPESRLYDPELGGGSLLDIGCYTLSLASLVFEERVTGGNIPEIEVRADLAPSGVDEHCKIVLRFGDGAEAYLESSISRAVSATGVIQGDRGRIVIPDFWRAQTLKLECETQDVATLECPFLCNGYEYQALELARMLRDGDIESPLLPHEESIGLIELMDDLRRRMGVQYPFEPSIGVTAGTHRAMTYRPFDALPLGARVFRPAAAEGGQEDAPAAGRLLSAPPEPLHLPRLVLGTMSLTNETPAAQDDADALLDAAFEHGLSAVDTGHVYGGGASERAIGDWLERSGLADDVFVLSKGCHPDEAGPRVNPEALARDLAESLDRLRLPAVDLYMLHRDDPAVPVGEMVDAFAEHLAAGRLRAYGFSNWTRARIEEACDYAEANDRPLPAASSPNFSLADQVNDPWGGGCATLTGAAAADDREWHREHRHGHLRLVVPGARPVLGPRHAPQPRRRSRARRRRLPQRLRPRREPRPAGPGDRVRGGRRRFGTPDRARLGARPGPSPSRDRRRGHRAGGRGPRRRRGPDADRRRAEVAERRRPPAALDGPREPGQAPRTPGRPHRPPPAGSHQAPHQTPGRPRVGVDASRALPSSCRDALPPMP